MARKTNEARAAIPNAISQASFMGVVGCRNRIHFP